MRWCYKTVHFDLKKEGFLGSVFLDEAEVEQSLNEYGQSGWELVSIVETQDGLIAFFKQPLEPVTKKNLLHPVEEYEVIDEDIISQPHEEQTLQSDEGFTAEKKPKPDNDNDNDNDRFTIRIE
jgi:hypothetical protein